MGSDEVDTTPTGDGDADLVLRARSGDGDAYAELWRRHYRSGIAVARSITSSLDPDDLVQEAYARIYQSIRRGGGPSGSFRAYLFTSIRNTAAGWGRARRETAIDELDAVADPSSTPEATADALDRGLTHRAFRSLPTRWQEVLWYSEIEGMKPAEIAPLLGLRSTAVAQLAFRAREGLREAWIQAHLQSVEDGSDCQWTIERLGAYARGNLGPRDTRRVDEHLHDCARCAIVAAEAKDVSSRLALVLLPLTIGIAGASSYLATLQGGGAPIVALAAMPSTLMPGAVTVAGGSGAAAGGAGSFAGGAGAGGAGSFAGGTGAGGAAGSGSGAVAGAAASGTGGAVAGAAAAGTATGGAAGIFSGAGLAVAVAVGAVVVAGTVLGISLAPAIFAPVTAEPGSAAGAASASPSSAPSPSTLPSTDTTDVPVDTSPSPAAEPVAPVSPPSRQTRPPASSPAPSAEPATPAIPVEPVDPAEPVDPVEPVDPDPVDPVDPVDPEQPTIPPGGPTEFSVTSTITLAGATMNISVVGEEGATLSVDVDGVTRSTVMLGPGGVGELSVPFDLVEYALAPVTVRYVPISGSPIEVEGSSALVWDLTH